MKSNVSFKLHKEIHLENLVFKKSRLGRLDKLLTNSLINETVDK